jgi:hypothetical protein
MANKKINQLVSKTAILSTDIFGIGDATTGQLFKKTIAELQAAIGGAVISVNGLVGTVVLDTDDIQELATPTNKYFTDARARGAISLTVTGNSGASTYSSGTGVLNVPTYTLAGLGGITATFLSGTSGISYNSTTGVISYSGTVYTDASIRALLSGSTGISYNSTTGAISYSGTVYTDSSVRALISITTTGDSGASTYNNTTGVINVPNYTLAGLGGISLTSLSGGTGITYNNTTGAISYSGTVYTDASVRALISAGTGISYNNITGVITSTITQYTDALARASISITTTGTSGASTYNSTTGVFNIPQYQSVLTNPVTGTGTTNYHAKFTSSSAIGNSLIFDNGTNLGIATSGGTYASTTLLLRATSATSTNYAFIIEDNATNEIFSIQNSGALTIKNAGTTRLTIASTGEAMFSSSVTAGSSGQVFVTGNAGTNSIGMKFINTGGNSFIGLSNSGGTGYLSGNAYAFNIQTESARDLQLGTNNATRMVITSAGIVNLYSPSTGGDSFNIYNSSSKLNIKMGGGGGSANQATLLMYNSSNTNTIWLNGAGDTDPSFITGYLAIGTTTNSGYRLYVSGTIYATGNITANSDLTLKKNLAIIENPTDKLMQLNGYAYQWKSDDSHQYGVIAQEVEKILPYAVTTGTDGIKGVSYNQIIPVLIEAVKEQKKELEELRNILASK